MKDRIKVLLKNSSQNLRAKKRAREGCSILDIKVLKCVRVVRFQSFGKPILNELDRKTKANQRKPKAQQINTIMDGACANSDGAMMAVKL